MSDKFIEREYLLAEEMESLKSQIEEGKSKNNKIKFKTFGRRTLQILKLGTSIVIVPAISSGILIACGWNPYKLNERNEPTLAVSYIDDKGTKTNYETNIPYGIEYYNTITYYDSWQKLDNNIYSRDIYKYQATSDSLLELIGILQTTEDISIETINNIISKTLIKEIEIKESLTKEELNKGAYVEGVYYDKNNDKKILTKETKESHTETLLGFILINIVLMIIEFLVLFFKFYFFENIRDAFKEPVYLVDVESLERKLEEVTKQLQDEVINKPKKKKLS